MCGGGRTLPKTSAEIRRERHILFSHSMLSVSAAFTRFLPFLISFRVLFWVYNLVCDHVTTQRVP